MIEKYIIDGMSCTACSSSVERVVRRIEGVKEANVNLIAKTLYIDYDESLVTKDKIISAVSKAGFKATLDIPKKEKKIFVEKEINNIYLKETTSIKTRLIISFSFLIPLMYVSMSYMFNYKVPNFISIESNPLLFAITQMILASPILYVNRKFFINGVKGIIHLVPNMDTLISLGSAISFIYGIIAIFFIAFGSEDIVYKYSRNLYFDSSAMILSLITIGKALEEKAKAKTTSAIESLKKLIPNTINIKENGIVKEIDSNELKAKDVVVIKPGEYIPVDGMIIEGSGYIDESIITGESIPVFKDINDSVVSGSINTDGYLLIEASSTIENTTLAKIINLVGDAGLKKAPIQRIADRISMYFVPTIIALSLITFIVWILIKKEVEPALYHSIQVLVISCPCALGLATPVAVSASLGKAARKGMLIKDAGAFETLNKVDTVIFDKTGTLTIGKPFVDRVVVNDINEEELLKIAKTLEIKSNHPISKAILEHTKDISEYESINFKNIPGKGVVAEANGEILIGGNKKLLLENNIDIDINIEENDSTILYFSKGNKFAGVITVRDKIKPTSKEAISLLKKKDIYVSMLSGDSFSSCNKIKEELAIDIAYDSVLPENKEKIISEVIDSGKTVMFVGDGINDSIALSRASVGVSLENATDIAIDSASVILLSNDLRDINNIIDISNKTVRIIKENLFWAFLYNIICIPVAMGAFSGFGINLSPMIASLFMSISSLIVVTNALRLIKTKDKKHGN